ncbi:MAG: hypothetical protein ABIH38_01560 [Patescibacteria group bacterium]
MKKLNKHSVIFLIIFIGLGLVFLRIPFSGIVGSSQSFTLFDYIGPTTGLFLGPLFGALSIFLVKIFNTLLGGQSLDFISILRFLPMMLAAVYLGTKTKKNIIIPLLCLILFIAHPQGRIAWYYSLYWLIPVFAVFKKNRLIFNALGATFTAHAVGSVIFLYAFNLPAAVWISLIPIVAIERSLFTLGIWVSYPVFNTILEKLDVKFHLPALKRLTNPNYVYSKKFFRQYA